MAIVSTGYKGMCRINAGQTSRSNKERWITGGTWGLIDARRDAKSKRDQARDHQEWKSKDEEYRCLNKEVKKSCRRDKKLWLKEKAKKHKKLRTEMTQRHFTG